ncbi:MAG TPA: DUF5668 domain-containing protein [Candidatus Dormibacteraeota bacterium]
MTRGWALFWGLVLVAVGGFALLFNLGWLQPEQLSRIIGLWPVLLILVGAQIVLARLLSRNQAAVALSLVAFVLLAGSVGYVVSEPPLHTAHATYKAVDDGSGPATLHISLGAATIRVGSDEFAGVAATARLDYTSGFGEAPVLRWNPSSRTLDISHDVGAQFLGPSSPDNLTVTLNSALDWSVQMETGASTASLNLASVHLKRFTLDGGADSLDLALGPPSGHVAVQVSGGASRIQLTRPAGAAVRVEVDGGADSLNVDGREVGSGIGSLTWSSPNYPGADAIDLSVDGGASRVTLMAAA